MLAAVKLNNKSSFETNKIYDVISDLLLPSEFKTTLF